MNGRSECVLKLDDKTVSVFLRHFVRAILPRVHETRPRLHKITKGPLSWAEGPNIMAEEIKGQFLSPTFKTDASSVHFLQRTNTILPCIYHVAKPEPTKFTKYHALNIARVDLSPPPLAVSQCFVFVFFCFFLIGWSVEGVSRG